MLVSENNKLQILSFLQLGEYKAVEEKSNILVNEGYSDPWLCNILAVCFAKQKKYLLAVKYFEILRDLYPNENQTYFNLGNLYRDAKNQKKALENYLLSHEKNHKHLDTIVEISKILMRIGKIDESKTYALKAKKLDPNSYKVNDLFGQIYHSTGEFIKALKIYKQLLNIPGKIEQTKVNIASNLVELGNYTEAKKFLEGNKTQQAKYNLSILKLREKNFLEGWHGYDIGIDIDERYLRVPKDRLKNLALWNPDKNFSSVLILGEQGIGDEIMFASLLSSLDYSKYRIGLLLDKRLKSLLLRSLFKHDFFERIDDAIIQGYESYIPIGSLTKFFRSSESDFLKSKKLILNADEEKIRYLKNSYNSSKPIIGLSWHTTNKSHGLLRNIKLKQFLPLFMNVNANFINLQYGDHKDEISKFTKKIKKNVFLEDCIDNKNDFDFFAAKISVCDLVVTIDNSTVHFAGSLNKETIALIPEICDWRWFDVSEKTLWYESVRLFRKSKNWDEVIIKLVNYCNKRFS